MTASVEVTAPIEEGSIVVLRNVEFGTPEVMEDVVAQIGYVAGHDRFLILVVGGDGDVETWGPDTDVRARVEALLAAARAQRPGTSTGGWQGPRSRPTPPPRP